MIKYEMNYNGHFAEEYDVFLNQYPTFSGGEKEFNVSQVSGRLGELVGEDISISNLEINCLLSVIGVDFHNKIRNVKKWLKGIGKLKFSDTGETFYRVWKVQYGDIEREIRKFGTFEVTFICTPYEYREDGQIEYEYDEIFNNPFDDCKPIYILTGEGRCTLTVNGKAVTAQVGQNLTIDSERMLCYREDGTLQNINLTGNYEDLWIPSGDLSISVSNGFNLKVIPNWGYNI